MNVITHHDPRATKRDTENAPTRAADTLSPRPNAHALETPDTSKTPACLNGGAVLQCAASRPAANTGGEKSRKKEKAQKAKRTRYAPPLLVR